jgi:uncharacterized protein
MAFCAGDGYMSDPTVTAQRDRDLAGIPPELSVIDADVHAILPNVDALLPYLQPYWREQVALIGSSYFYTPYEVSYPPGAPTSFRSGTVPDTGEPTEVGLACLRKYALDAWGVEQAIVSCAHFVDMFHNPYLSEAFAAATNDWLITEWLEREPRLRGSMLVAASQPELAEKEINRVGDHPGIVQVLLPAWSAIPYGNPLYHGIFRAAAEHDLVVGIHYGGWPGSPPTGVGWSSFYIEEWVGRAQWFQSQLMSLIAEGIFVRFPATRVALVEAGWAWLPAFLWRFDTDWKALRREVPWVDRRPSHYVTDHVKFTLQPIDGPVNEQDLASFIDRLDSDDLLMFSSDYPHWHYDEPAEALPSGISESSRVKILASTARAFYRMESSI